MMAAIRSRLTGLTSPATTSTTAPASALAKYAGGVFHATMSRMTV